LGRSGLTSQPYRIGGGKRRRKDTTSRATGLIEKEGTLSFLLSGKREENELFILGKSSVIGKSKSIQLGTAPLFKRKRGKAG